MGNCESLSSTATASVTVRNESVVDGSEEAAMIYNNGMITGTKVSLSFECKGLPNMDVLSKSDPFVVVYLENGNGVWNEIGRTEIVVNNLNPVFVKKIIMTYKFEAIQKLKFAVYDADENSKSEDIKLDRQDFIGEITSALSSIVHKQDVTTLDLILANKKRGQIIVKCEELSEVNGIVRGCFKGKDINSKCFYRVYNLDEKNGETAMYKSEVAKNGNWNPFEINSLLFCNGDLNRPIIIRVYKFKSNGSHVLIGSLTTSTSKLNCDDNLVLPLTGDQASGSILVDSFTFIPRPSFLQYVQNGLDLNFMVAVDFTGSNGSPTDPSSLHYCNPNLYAQGVFNPYEKAIMTVGSVLEYYDSDKLFPCYGFGACLDFSRTSSHCFALNRNEAKPDVYGIGGIMDAYHTTLTSVRFSGPTLFQEILKKANSVSAEIKPMLNKYLVLLIITDGAIHDMDESIKQIVQGADLPLSILIVGVGNNDFGNMNILDGDEERLSFGGKVASRDIVQFVAMNEMKSQSPEDIAKALLEEIPGQVTEYMEQNAITLETIKAICPYSVTIINPQQ